MIALPYPIEREEWQPIVGLPGYEVSSYGCVRSWRAWGGRGHRRAETPRAIKTFADPHGYLGFNAMRDGKHTRIYVHQELCRAFWGECPFEKGEARHADGNRSWNSVNNLSWGTKSDNERDKWRHGTHNKGERHGNSKLTDDKVRCIFEMRRAGAKFKDIGLAVGISATHACRVYRRECWTHLSVA